MKRIYKNWFVHNVIAHPSMQIFQMLGMSRAANFIHEVTLPESSDEQ